MRRLLAFALALLLVPSLVWGQSYVIPGASVSSLVISATSAANTAVTATLPALAGRFHYVTAIQMLHSCSAAVAGSAVLSITTTNLPGSLAFINGDACAIGSDHETTMYFNPPLKSSVINTNTTVVCPAFGATAICTLNVAYFTAP